MLDPSELDQYFSKILDNLPASAPDGIVEIDEHIMAHFKIQSPPTDPIFPLDPVNEPVVESTYDTSTEATYNIVIGEDSSKPPCTFSDIGSEVDTGYKPSGQRNEESRDKQLHPQPLTLSPDQPPEAMHVPKHYFYVIESFDKITLINDEFIVWLLPIVPTPEDAQTLSFIASHRDGKPNLELIYSTKGCYNRPTIILKLLEKFLEEILENEQLMHAMK